MRLIKLGLIAVLIAAASAAFAGPNLVVNGGFETGDFTGWTLSGSPFEPSVSFVTGPFYIWAPEAGNYFFSMGNVGTDGIISQSIATNPGDVYNVSYYFGSDGDTPNDFSSYFAGQTLYSAVNIPAQPYTFYSFDVTATTASSLLQFNERDDPAYMALDTISVTDITPTGTPEPGSLALLLGAGACGSAVAIKRRRSRA